jgi:hypothetical protein
VIRAVVHAPDLRDADGAILVLSAAKALCTRMKLVWADIGYRGPNLKEWIERECKWQLDIVKRPSKQSDDLSDNDSADAQATGSQGTLWRTKPAKIGFNWLSKSFLNSL